MPRNMNRREMLSQSLGAVAVAGGGLAVHKHVARAGAPGEPMDAPPILDTHQHLWDLKRFRLSWTDHVPPLRRTFSMQDYLEATRGLGVVKTIYMEVDVEPSQQQAEADAVVEICRRGDTPMVAAVISGRPAEPSFPEYVGKYRDHPHVKGLRQVLHVASTPPGYCLREEFVAGIRLLGKLGLSFDLCVRAAEIPDATRLIDACPDTRFILDHCGNADVQAKDHAAWRRDMAELARRRNVVGKVSGIVASATPGKWTADDLAPIINHTLDVFGPARIMFGGDWPVCTLAASYRQWVDALRQIIAPRSVQEQRQLFAAALLRQRAGLL